MKKQIVRELNFNKDCASDHICRYYGAFMDKSTGTISIAMEFCEGGSLDSIYKEVKKLGGRTGEKVLGKVAEGVLNGLTYLHGRKIIHRGRHLYGQCRPFQIANQFHRHQAFQHSPVPGRSSQALRFRCQRRVRHQGRCEHLYRHFLLYGSRTYHWSIIHHHL